MASSSSMNQPSASLNGEKAEGTKSKLLQNYQHAVDCLIQCEYLCVSLQEQLAAKDKYIASIEVEREASATETLIQSLQHQIKTKNKEIATLKGKRGRMATNQFECIVLGLQQQLSLKDEKISTLERQISIYQCQNLSVESLQEGHKLTVESLQEDVKAKGKDIAKGRSLVRSLEEKIVQMSYELASSKTMIDEQAQMIHQFKQRLLEENGNASDGSSDGEKGKFLDNLRSSWGSATGNDPPPKDRRSGHRRGNTITIGYRPIRNGADHYPLTNASSNAHNHPTGERGRHRRGNSFLDNLRSSWGPEPKPGDQPQKQYTNDAENKPSRHKRGNSLFLDSLRGSWKDDQSPQLDEECHDQPVASVNRGRHRRGNSLFLDNNVRSSWSPGELNNSINMKDVTTEQRKRGNSMFLDNLRSSWGRVDTDPLSASERSMEMSQSSKLTDVTDSFSSGTTFASSNKNSWNNIQGGQNESIKPARRRQKGHHKRSCSLPVVGGGGGGGPSALGRFLGLSPNLDSHEEEESGGGSHVRKLSSTPNLEGVLFPTSSREVLAGLDLDEMSTKNEEWPEFR